MNITLWRGGVRMYWERILHNDYSVSETIKNMYALICTKLTFPQCRLIRRPVYIRGSRSVCGAKNLTTGYACRFDLDGKKKTLFIGDNCQFGDYTHIVALRNVHIGNHVLLASNVFISDCDHGSCKGRITDSPQTPPDERALVKGETCIGDNVWIGKNAVILRGSRIGSGCIIGANAVIKKSVPENCIVAGNNRIIRRNWGEGK